MTIGIDIDNTITDTSKTSNQLLASDIRFKGINSYRELNRELKKEFLSDYIKETVSRPKLKSEVVNVLKHFKSKGHKIVFITARGNEETRNFENLKTVAFTSLYFCKNNLIYDKIIFFQDNKGDACLSEGVDIFIDDKEEVLDEVSSKNIKTIKMSDKREKSNHYLVTSWLEVKKYIDTCGVK